MIRRFLSAIGAAWRSLFGRSETSENNGANETPDVDDVARTFYDNMIDADRKRKKK